MPIPRSLVTSIGFTLIVAAWSISAFAQQESVAPATLNSAPVNTVYFRSLLLNDIRNGPKPFSTEVAGALRGRVLHEVYSTSPVEPQGVGGVRLILRSVENDVQAIVGHRITDAEGKYEFASVSPGKYSIEVDRLSVPARVRSSGIVVSRIGFEKSLQSAVPATPIEESTIKGFVFIDRDGNGQYDLGIDQPVSGAHITGNGRFAVSESNGSYTLGDLPTGRTGVLVSLPKTNDNAHVVLETNTLHARGRIVNIPMNR